MAIETGMPAASGISMSIGEAYYPDDGSDAEELLAEADRRMYKSKHLRKRYKMTMCPQTTVEIAAIA
jgi:GGDEF domain-containing protein